MKKFAIAVLLALLIPAAAFAQTANHTVDPTDINIGYMNVSDLGGGFLWGSGWGFDALAAYYDGADLVLAPAPVDDPDPYWYDGDLVGQKIMEAISYAEVNVGYAGRTVNFSGEVLENTLTPGHTVVAFIKDFAPDFSSFVEVTAPLNALGIFSLTLNTVDDTARHVQWGFRMTGVNVHPTLADQFGHMVIGPDPAVVPAEDLSFGDLKALYR